MGKVTEERPYVPYFKDLNFVWHPPSPPLEPTEVVGMYFIRDDEGYAIKCYQSDGKLWTFPKDLQEFLDIDDPRIFFVDGADREMECVIKYLGEEVCAKLLDGTSVSIGGTVVSYHGGLSTRRSGGRSLRRIWMLKPFFPAYMTPIDDDCYGVQARGERLIKVLIGAGLPLSLYSCGSILSSMADLPFNSCPTNVTEMAYNCYHGGWIESLKLGYFNEAYDYDLSSAYPTEAAKLYSCSPHCGSWYEVPRFVQEAVYGFAYCRVSIDMSLPFSPIMIRLRSLMSANNLHPIRIVRNPIGTWEGWMTKDEIEFIVRNWLGDVEVLSGHWFVPTHYFQPFLPLVNGLNGLRQYSKSIGDKLASYISKIVPATLQGKFIQSSIINGKRMVGTAFNPVYAATITARVRLRVAEAALEDCDHVLGLIVDGILADRPLPLSNRWKLEYKGKCVVANHGDYDIDGRDTSLPLKQVLEENYNGQSYPLRGVRYVSLSEAIEGDMFKAAGRRRPESFTNVRKVGKRSWIKLPHTCGDLLEKQYESYPLFVGERSSNMDNDNRVTSPEDLPEEFWSRL